MAILVIEPEELQEMELEEYTKEAQKMLANVAKTKRLEMGFLFIDDYKFDEDDIDEDGDLVDQTVFITGTNFDLKWKPMHFNELKKIGYKQDTMWGKCLYDKKSGTLHLFEIEGGSILNKNLDLKFNNYLKDMKKKNVFKGWKFYDKGVVPELEIDDVENEIEPSDRYQGDFDPINVTSETKEKAVKYMDLIAKLNRKAQDLGADDDEDFEEYMIQLGEEAVYNDVEQQKSIIQKIRILFDAYEKDEDEELFKTEEEKKAANEERKKLAVAVPNLSEKLHEVYQEAERFPELSEDNYDMYDFDGNSEVLEELLDASWEVRKALMGIFKFYAQLAKAAKKK